MDDLLHILIIDDDEVDRIATKRALSRSDITAEISEAENCREAQDIVQSQDFSCILLDYRLPDGTALDFMQHLRESERRMPVIVLTGQGDEKIAVELMKAGASDYFSKALLSPELLSQSIRSALRVYAAEQETQEANQQLRNTNLLLQSKNQQLEQQKQQIHLQNLQLLEASDLKSQFLASMSHELRTPMHAIMGFSQILLQGVKGELNPDQSKMVERILDNSDNLLGLLNDLLDFSKGEAGQLEFEFQEFNLARLVVETIEELQSLADQAGLSIEPKIKLKDRKIVSDKNRLRQVLVNLISNAIKFTDKGSVTIEISEAEDKRIAIAVRDTGIGIDPEKFGDIFDAFRQLHQTMARKYPGTGLGLAISKSLVEMIQGEIKVESQVGRGSTFTVLLPRIVDKAAVIVSPESSSASSVTSPSA